MNYASAWFLVSIATGQYIGPLPHPACDAAAAQIATLGIVCKGPAVMTACAVLGRPDMSTACPVFDFPHVTVKP